MDAVDAVVLKAARDVLEREEQRQRKGEEFSAGLCAGLAYVASQAIFQYLNHASSYQGDTEAKAAMA